MNLILEDKGYYNFILENSEKVRAQWTLLSWIWWCKMIDGYMYMIVKWSWKGYVSRETKRSRLIIKRIRQI